MSYIINIIYSLMSIAATIFLLGILSNYIYGKFIEKSQQNRNINKFPKTIESDLNFVLNPSANRLNLKKILNRFLDILISSNILFFSLPYFFLIGILLKLYSKGSTFYKERVYTIFGTSTIRIVFRTFNNEYLKNNELVINKFGHFLNKTRLVNLPSVFNILRGNLTFVGLTLLPETQEVKIQKLKKYFPLNRRFIKPGLISLYKSYHVVWREDFGSSEDIDLNLIHAFDTYYIENKSFWLDLKIVIRYLIIMIGVSTTYKIFNENEIHNTQESGVVNQKKTVI